jgi:hypothetical protein
MTSPIRRIVVLCAGICLAAACSTVKETVKTATDKPTLPGATQTVAVSKVSERGGYLEATLATEVPMGFYFAATETCRALLVEGSEVQYSNLGTFGAVAGSAGQCTAEGTASLRTWHDQYLRRTIGGRPREIVRFKKTYGDDSVLMIRGRLSLAALLGMMADDVVAVLPASADCDSLAKSGEAFMNYERSTGPVFYLEAGGTRCEFLGVARPIRD